MEREILRIENLGKSFGNLVVLQDINLTVRRGEVVCIIGPSGSGKSTVLRCINFLTPPSKGRIVFDGVEVSASQNLSLVRRELGMVFQQFNLFPHMTVVQNVMSGLRFVRGMSRPLAQQVALQELRRVGLAEKAQERPVNLSGGQQQRVAIARALAMEPKIMMFDEPTSALDPELVGEVLNVMKSLAEDGMTMIVVTHEMTFASRVGHRIVMIDKGRIIEEGSPDQVLREPTTTRARQFLEQLEWK